MKAFALLIVLALSLSSTEARRSRSGSRQRSEANVLFDDSPSKLEDSTRHGKLFSLFNVVTFKQDSCTTTGGTTGTCLSAAECSRRANSAASGNCAAGFGVCCLSQTQTCGATVSENCTYIQNPGYDGTYNTEGTCSYTVRQCSNDICRVRLDYVDFDITGPNQNNNGHCDIDSLVVSGMNNVAAGKPNIFILQRDSC